MKNEEYRLDLVDKTNLIFICRITKHLAGIEFFSYQEAINAFKQNYPDLIILPITIADTTEALKKIEFYYSLYKSSKELGLSKKELGLSNKVINKMKNILIKYHIIDNECNLIMDLNSLGNEKNRKIILIKEKSIKKEFELNNIFLEINCRQN